MGRGKNTKKATNVVLMDEDIPLEGPPVVPMEGITVPREDVVVPREDVVMDREEVPTEEVAPPTRTRDTTPAPPPMNKTQSEINVEDSLITSFVNGAKSREIEVVFAFDTTGSMNKYLDEVRKKLKETCTKLTKDIPSIRIGIMAFGDYCDYGNYVVKSQDLCNDTDKLVKWVETVSKTSGGDAPEAYELALREAKSLGWSPLPQVNKAFVIIGDLYPHAPSYTTEKIYWRDEVAGLVKKGVKIYGVHCGTPGDTSHPFYEEVAEMSGGICLSLKHLQLITDMFKAVCYREFGAEHLETYRAEVAEGGRMDDKMEDLFAQLKQGPNAKAKYGERSTMDWYLSKFDHGTTPSYSWNSSTNKWEPYSAAKAAKASTPATPPAKSLKRKDDEPDAPTTTTTTPSSPSKKAKKAPAEKKEAPAKKEKKVEKKKTTPKKEKKEKGAKKAKKVEKDSEDEEEEEKPKKLKKATSHIVGNGDWKRDRHGRMASLHEDD